MGLSYAPNYTWTAHFEKRAFERFGVDSERLAKWVARQRGSLTPYDLDDFLQPGVEKYVSRDGVIFVCNTLELTFVTCYEANDLIEEGKKTTIHAYNVDLFNQEMEKLAHRYRLKDSKEMLLSVSDHLDSFYKLSQKIMSGRLSEKNYAMLASLIDDYHVVKAAMRIIETKGTDFKIYPE